MSITRDILATYWRPRQIFAKRMADGPREDRALAILMAACVIIFVAQWPRIAREAHLTDQELNPLLGGALLGWVFIAPLFFYVVSIVVQLVGTLFGSITGYRSRIALFWSLLAVSPLVLFQGLLAGFVGPSPANTITGLLWLGIFGVLWAIGVTVAGRSNV